MRLLVIPLFPLRVDNLQALDTVHMYLCQCRGTPVAIVLRSERCLQLHEQSPSAREDLLSNPILAFQRNNLKVR
jgi:hypothetical protein